MNKYFVKLIGKIIVSIKGIKYDYAEIIVREPLPKSICSTKDEFNLEIINEKTHTAYYVLKEK